MMALFLPTSLYSVDDMQQSQTITEWEIMWIDDTTPNLNKDVIPDSNSGWLEVDSQKSIPLRPKGVTSAWMKLTLPQLQYNNLGLYMPLIYAQNIVVYLEDQQVYHIETNYTFDQNRILLSVDTEDSGKSIYIWMENPNQLNHFIGLDEEILIGNYSELMSIHAKKDLGSIILGGAFVLIAMIVLIMSVFLKKEQILISIALGVVILTIGIIFITSPPYVYIFFKDFGSIFLTMFDIALFISIPALLYFFELIFGSGYRNIITNLRKFQVVYSLFCLLFMIVNNLSSNIYNTPYYFATATVFGIFVIIHLTTLCMISIKRALSKDKDALIFSAGVALFTSSVVIDLIWFYSFGSHSFMLWTWGAVCFVISLILLLGRRLASYHQQITNYSTKLEMFSYELQRSEKMGIISELAASIAHEVRNPLQVTRGFLQLFAEKTDVKEKEYMNLAIQELDRAANIITDFLTFAKPQLDDITRIDIVDELKRIEGIMAPLANLQGGKIALELSSSLYIQGSSAKFKQVIINIIKNSIEAFGHDGYIHIRAFRDRDEIIIKIKDNGEGMDSEGLLRLGEPFFSTKTKGTGLGLMVSFRIVEIMKGFVQINSIKGEGTEVVIRFPYAQ